MANYQDRSKPPFYLFSLPGHEAGASTYSNALEPAMKFVSAWFGKPTAPIAIADLADPNSAPFESGTLLMASMAAEDSKLAGTNLVHELVHSALPSSRPWVYEGLAHFAEALYREEQGGREAALDLLGLHRAAFLDSEKEAAAAQKSAGQPLATTFDETYYRSKAAYVWWMLRDMIGDDALKQAIGKYRAEDDKDPKYVERLIESAAKRDLGMVLRRLGVSGSRPAGFSSAVGASVDNRKRRAVYYCNLGKPWQRGCGSSIHHIVGRGRDHETD